MAAPPILVKALPATGAPLQRWDELLDVHRKYFGLSGRWVFRGINNSKYGLKTSLERAVLSLALSTPNPTPDEERSALAGTFGDLKRTVFEIEGGLIRSFRRQLHHYVDRQPSTPLELLALMQHYGAPTRLIDWTYSFYVALFFAVDGSARNERCAVWALDAEWFRDRLLARDPALYAVIDDDRNLIKRASSFKDVFRQEQRFVCPMNPYYLNDRLIIQQGLFLCPGAVGSRFEDNVAELQYDDRAGSYAKVPDAEERLIRIDIGLSGATRTEILQNLIRMNMSHATLFPGIQGFARSHEGALVFPDTLQYGDKYETDFVL